MTEKPVWDKGNPKKKHKKLTPALRAKAKARATKNGRKYPNLVDNMWAAKGAKTKKAVTKVKKPKAVAKRKPSKLVKTGKNMIKNVTNRKKK